MAAPWYTNGSPCVCFPRAVSKVLAYFPRECPHGAVGSAEASGNFALPDMIRALHWVQNNIASYAGDPDRVILFGESAGARNIMGLLASPLSGGLFHRAIVHSGLVATFTPERAENYRDGSRDDL